MLFYGLQDLTVPLFQDPELNGGSITLLSEVYASAMLLLLVVGNSKQ